MTHLGLLLTSFARTSSGRSVGGGTEPKVESNAGLRKEIKTLDVTPGDVSGWRHSSDTSDALYYIKHIADWFNILVFKVVLSDFFYKKKNNTFYFRPLRSSSQWKKKHFFFLWQTAVPTVYSLLSSNPTLHHTKGTGQTENNIVIVQKIIIKEKNTHKK